MTKVKMTVPAHRLLCEIAAHVRAWRHVNILNAASDVMDGKYRSYDQPVRDLTAAGVICREAGSWALTDLGVRMLLPLVHPVGAT